MFIFPRLSWFKENAPSPLVAFFLFAMSGLMCSTSVYATVYSEAVASAGNAITLGSDQSGQTTHSTTPIEARASVTGASGEASATTSQGRNSVYAAGYVSSPGDYACGGVPLLCTSRPVSASGYALSRWDDVMTISSGTGSGGVQQGQFTFRFDGFLAGTAAKYDGTYNSGYGSGQADAYVYIAYDPHDNTSNGEQFYAANPYWTGNMNGVGLHEPIVLNFNFNDGEATEFLAELSVNAFFSSTQFTGSAQADLSHTLELIGVTLPQGYTLSSASGTTYPNISSVPEPETYAMLLAGLGLLGFAARRRNGVSRQAA